VFCASTSTQWASRHTPCPWWAKPHHWFHQTLTLFLLIVIISHCLIPSNLCLLFLYTPWFFALASHCPWLLALVYKLFVCVYYDHHEIWLVQLAPACICYTWEPCPHCSDSNLNADFWRLNPSFIFLHSLCKGTTGDEKDKDIKVVKGGPICQGKLMEIWDKFCHMSKFSSSIQEVSSWCFIASHQTRYSSYSVTSVIDLGVKNFRDFQLRFIIHHDCSGEAEYDQGLGLGRWVPTWNMEQQVYGSEDCKEL